MLKINSLSKKIVILIVIAVFAIAGGLFAWSTTNNSTENNKPRSDTINYNPPTEEEKQNAADNKQRIVNEEEKLANQEPTPEGTKKSVKPVITSAEQYKDNVEISAFVSSIFEDNGTCTANFSKSSHQFNKQVTAVKEGRAVYCPLLSVPTSQFPEKGKWNVSVTYSSTSSYGVSDTAKFEVK